MAAARSSPAPGIGKGIALELAAHGAGVAITDIAEPSAAEPMVTGIEDGGGTALFVRLDVSDEQQVATAFAAARTRLGGLDLLVNNAGVEKPFPLAEMPLEEWRKVIDVN